jgi:hypothetical protein
MKRIQLYEGFLRKTLNIKDGVFKIVFNNYYAIANLDNYGESGYEEEEDFYTIDPASYLDYLILNVIEKIKNDNEYKIINKNEIKINNRKLKLDVITYKYNDEFSKDDKDMFIYRLRNEEDAIETFKKLDSIINLEKTIINDKKMKNEFKNKLVKFISENIRDINYILNASNFDLI